MAMSAEVRHLSISSPRPPDEVYAFCADPHNLPRWAEGLAQSVRFEGETLIAQSPMGEITVRFAERNAFGVLDHVVTLASGDTFNNPMRVLPNGDGSEVVFTLFRQPGVSDEEYERDAAAVTRDLRALARLLAGG